MSKEKTLITRNIQQYALYASITILLGLFSRTQYTPSFLLPYLGDILYATLIYFISAILFRRSSIETLFTITIITCFTIEFSQLYQAPWINSLRNTTIGSLILGHGFLWSDLFCYILGTIVASLLDKIKTPTSYGRE